MQTNTGLSAQNILHTHLSLQNIRKYFVEDGFIESNTPYLIKANAPDPHIDPLFVQVLGKEQQLHTSPELWLKRVLSLGFNKVFEIARVFRNDPPSPAHNPEFTMIEWYRSHSDLKSLIADCEKLFFLSKEAYQRSIGADLCSPPILYQIETVTVVELFLEYAGIDLIDVQRKIFTHNLLDALQIELSAKGDRIPANASFADAFFHIFIKYIEPKLPFNKPTAVMSWPIQLAALAAPCAADQNFCDRFEIYFRGLEIANAYQECNDQEVIRSRFIKENQERAALAKPVFDLDEGFLRALDRLPALSGIALGFDRLLMVVAEKSNINEVCLR